MTLFKTTLLGAAMLLAAGLTAAEAQPRHGGGQMFDFEATDLNGDGLIDAAELEALAATRFAEIDADGDGLVSAAELTAHGEARAAEARAERAERMVARRDSDGDGQLSAEEMAPEGDRLARMIERLDSDGDGAVSEAELAEMRARWVERRHPFGDRG